eukprot:COSAG02_NODE_379_length_23528_cov_140.781510_6_plen_303_part_00
MGRACTFVPPSWIEAAQRRLAFVMIDHARLGSEAHTGHTLSPDLLELVGAQVVGFDHLAEDSKLKAYGQDSQLSRETFRPLDSLWESTADQKLLATAWTALREGRTLPVALTAAGFSFEVPRGVGSTTDKCNGLYVVCGERKGCPVLHNWRSGYYCVRIGSADFPDDENSWGWQITEENPEFFLNAATDEWGFVSLTNAGGQDLYSCLIVEDFDLAVGAMAGQWPVGRQCWTRADGDPDIAGDPHIWCTMTLLDSTAVKAQTQTIVEELRSGVQRFMDGVVRPLCPVALPSSSHNHTQIPKM